MSIALNKVVLGGSINRAPRFQTTSGGKRVSNFTLKIPGHGNSFTLADVTAWQAHADTARDFVAGDVAIVTGRLASETYEKDGKTVFKLSVVADSVEKVEALASANSEGGDAAIAS